MLKVSPSPTFGSRQLVVSWFLHVIPWRCLLFMPQL